MASAFKKNIRREIRQSLGRYLAILSIAALGVGFFAGLKITRSAMINTGDEYINGHNMYDFKLLSSYGLTEDDAASLAALNGINAAVGSYSHDALITLDGGTEYVASVHSLTGETDVPDLTAGRLPEADNECLLDSRGFGEACIGSILTICDSNPEDTEKAFAYKEYKAVGLMRSVNYLNIERGNTKLGSGTVTGFVYIPAGGFDSEFYTEIYLDADISGGIYTDEYNDGIAALTDSVSAALDARGEVRLQSIKDEANAQLDDARREYADGLTEYEKQKSDAEAALASALVQLTEGEKKLADGYAALDARREDEEILRNAVATLPEKIAELEALLAAATDAATADYLTAELSGARAVLADAELNLGKLEAVRAELDSQKKTLSASRAEYEAQRADADRSLAEALTRLSDASHEIADAEAGIAELAPPDTYVLTRSENTGYVCFESDSSIVEGIARIFPLFFFLVAALVCMTTMTRMIGEQRTQIGTLKALGYSNSRILFKYISYSGSSALLGGTIGYVAGTRLFPWVIWVAYSILYGFTDISYIFDIRLALISLAVSLLCSVGTTWAVCRRELASMPAELMRPKAPKAGKRIFLERIPLLWNRFGFLRKVSLRNIFRYRKRMLMMLLGVGGCTALLLTGFGIRDSISNIASYQFDEIMKYDYTVTFSAPQNDTGAFRERFGSELDRLTFVCQTSAEAYTPAGVKDVIVIATDDGGVTGLFDLHGRDGNAIPYPAGGEVVLSEKLASMLGAKVGDEVTLKTDETASITLRMSGICKNYVYNYAYMTAGTYESSTGDAAELRYAYATAREGTDLHGTAAAMMDGDGVMNVSVTQDMRERVASMMESLDYVVWLVIACAAALAFIVLVNLSNINITERQREIATIKVLGFYQSETASYVFRENVMLTFMGALIGLPLGVLLHRFVMSQIKIDMVSFDTVLLPVSYLLSFVMTMAFTLIVDLLMRSKLRKINMAESLKSVE